MEEKFLLEQKNNMSSQNYLKVTKEELEKKKKEFDDYDDEINEILDRFDEDAEEG